MAQPQKRYDGYGRPLPTVVEARPPATQTHPVNTQAWETILAQIEAYYRAVLVRGTHAELTIVVGIKDGVVMQNLRISITHTIPREGPGEHES